MESLDNHKSKDGNNIFKRDFALALLIMVFILLPLFLFIGYSQTTKHAEVSSPEQAVQQQVRNDTSNLEAQNACISNAQMQLDNNPLYVNNAYGKSLAMQSKIDDCKSRYPTS